MADSPWVHGPPAEPRREDLIATLEATHRALNDLLPMFLEAADCRSPEQWGLFSIIGDSLDALAAGKAILPDLPITLSLAEEIRRRTRRRP